MTPRSPVSSRAGVRRRRPLLRLGPVGRLEDFERRRRASPVGRRRDTMAPQRKTFPRLFLARSEPFRLAGDRVFLRPPERGDYDEWASLRARSRNP
jgi:hypothetical protein